MTEGSVRLNINGKGLGTVEVNGSDISNVVTGVDVHVRVGAPPEVYVTVLPRALEVFVDGARIDVERLPMPVEVA